MDKPYEKAVQGLETGPALSDAPAAPEGGVAGDAQGHPSVAVLRKRFGAAVLKHVVYSGNEHTVYTTPERAHEVLRWLKEDAQQSYDYLQDLTAIDYGGGRPLEIVYQLWSNQHKRQLRVKVALSLQALELDTVVDLWQTANWLERETFDLFGVHFRGHPDLRRILMPENYAEGYPLRKDFPLRGRFSRAEQTRRALAMDVEDFYTPTELEIGGEVSGHGDSPAHEPVRRPAPHAPSDPAITPDPVTERAPPAGQSPGTVNE
ncbi:MAG TPA: NADH-quinone oxidoreductase subunit C [Longimicrobiales bacterium]|nr:NADH-quinone oxidoreductase subunit C [Longimicrobiales bacterium]